MVRAGLLFTAALLSVAAPAAAKPKSAFQKHWVEAYESLDCRAPHFGASIASRAPLKFALIAMCRDLPDPEEVGGAFSLVVVDESAGTVEAIHMPGVSVGGLHPGADGDWFWFNVESTPDQKRSNLVLYGFRPGDRQARRIAATALPFAGGSPHYVVGEGCGVVVVQPAWSDPRVPPLAAVLPHAGTLEGATAWLEAGWPEFWRASEQAFVTDATPLSRGGGVAAGAEPQFLRVACTGKAEPLETPWGRALAARYKPYGQYAPSPAGDDLLGALQKDDLSVLSLIGPSGDVRTLGPFNTVYDDHDGSPVGSSSVTRPQWSPSGQRFVVDVDDELYVYDTATLQVVKSAKLANPRNVPQFAFLDDHTVVVFNDHSRVTFVRF